MTKEELSEKGIDIEPFAEGFIIADYSGVYCEARFCDRTLLWYQEPISMDPFSTEERAIEAVCKLL